MTFPRFRRAQPALDDEGKRAAEALARVMTLQKESGASPEWQTWRRRRRHRHVRRSVLTVAMVLGAGILGSGGWFGGRFAFAMVRDRTTLLRVQRVDITGLERLTEAEVLASAELAAGQYLFDVRPEVAAARLSAVPLVRGATVRRTWKREILIDITERHAAALALLDRPIELDETGVVLPLDASGFVADLPIIRGLEGAATRAGSKLPDPAAAPAATLAARLADHAIGLADEVSEILADDPDSLVLIMMAGSLPVKVGRGDIPERRLMALRTVLDDLKRREIDAEYVDLRFAGQVVYKPKLKPEEPAEAVVAPPIVTKRRPAKTGTVNRHGAGKTKERRSRHGRHT